MMVYNDKVRIVTRCKHDDIRTNYLTQRQKHFSYRIVPRKSIIVKHVKMKDSTLQLLNRETCVQNVFFLNMLCIW